MKIPPLGWVFNRQMILGAILGFFIFGALGEVRKAWHHKGPGYVTYGDGDYVDYYREKVSEREYKRHHYGNSVPVLCILFWLWVASAKAAIIPKDKTYE